MRVEEGENIELKAIYLNLFAVAHCDSIPKPMKVSFDENQVLKR